MAALCWAQTGVNAARASSRAFLSIPFSVFYGASQKDNGAFHQQLPVRPSEVCVQLETRTETPSGGTSSHSQKPETLVRRRRHR